LYEEFEQLFFWFLLPLFIVLICDPETANLNFSPWIKGQIPLLIDSDLNTTFWTTDLGNLVELDLEQYDKAQAFSLDLSDSFLSNSIR